MSSRVCFPRGAHSDPWLAADAAGWYNVNAKRSAYALTAKQIMSAPVPLPTYHLNFRFTAAEYHQFDYFATEYSDRGCEWAKGADFMETAISVHGSEENVLKKAASRQQAAEKTKLTKKRKAEDREEELKAMEKLCGASRDDIEGCDTHRCNLVFKMCDRYIDKGDELLTDVVTSICQMKFLQDHTLYVSNIELLGYDNFQCNWPRKHDETGGAMERMALRPFGGTWPWLWPWVTWSPDKHRFASDECKCAVRAWLGVAFRLKLPTPVSMRILQCIFK
jgi:hypothetical protein